MNSACDELSRVEVGMRKGEFGIRSPAHRGLYLRPGGKWEKLAQRAECIV